MLPFTEQLIFHVIYCEEKRQYEMLTMEFIIKEENLQIKSVLQARKQENKSKWSYV